MDLSRFPQVALCHRPTPLEPLHRLANHLGGPAIYIKRDDCTGLALGGNKARKLEFLVAEAVAQGCDTLVTIGGLQSNHCRQTAAAAAKCGLRCELILPHLSRFHSEAYEINGNVLLDRLFGAKLHIVASMEAAAEHTKQVLEGLRNAGSKPYFIPAGGSTALGALGYVDAARELGQQAAAQALRVDHVFVTTGSSTTHAGLVVGFYALELSHDNYHAPAVTGISVYQREQPATALVRQRARETAELMGLATESLDERVTVTDAYLGRGYGEPTEGMIEAVQLAARLEGLLLDPVYTGKTMAGLIDLVRQGRFRSSDNIVFMHTGGMPALFAYRDAFARLWKLGVPNLWRNGRTGPDSSPAILRELRSPTTEVEVAQLVEQAAKEGAHVRVCGTGHSFQPLCATSDLLISLDNLAGIESVDVATSEAVILAGTKLHALGEPLAARGLALENQGDVDVQALAGAVSTGTHGTGRELGSISTQVVGVRVVSGDGSIHEVDLRENPDTFRALAVSLGSCGILTAIRMRLLPAYRLHERTWREPIDACLSRLEERISATRHYEFFWYPQADEALCKALQPTNADPSPLDSRDGERIDHNYRIFPTVRNVRFNEMEYAVPAEAGLACFAEIRKLMRERHPNVTWPIEYRTVAADNLDLSPNYGRETIAISIHQAAELEHRVFFADAEPIFRHHGGRPHWGKLHSLTARELAPLYPRWQHFASIRERFDPRGVFLNHHLRSILIS